MTTDHGSRINNKELPKILISDQWLLFIERRQRRAAYRRRPACPECRQDACVTSNAATEKPESRIQNAESPEGLVIDHCSLIIERPRRAAFTLIEILVVLSIIVLLIAILVPAAILAERYAYSSATQGDLAALGQALSVYHSDFNMYPDSDLCYAPAGGYLYPGAPGGGIPSGNADEYLAECLLGYLPGEFDGAPSDSTLGANGYSGGNISQCAGFAMQPYKKVYGPYMPVNAPNITPGAGNNYYFSGDFPPTAGVPLPILYFSATTSPSTSQIFGATPGAGVFCSADDPGSIPDAADPVTTTDPMSSADHQFFQLIGDKTGTNDASGGTITGRNSYLLVAPGPSQLAYGGDSLVYGGQ